MAPSSFPYTLYSCPCTGTTSIATRRASQQFQAIVDEDDEHAFDPRSPLADYSLYPLENLLYCNDCREIRCPRCCTEEVVTWYCPQCLFEVTGLGSRTEGGRCNRSCFSCPLCTAPLTVSSLSPSIPDADTDAIKNGPFILLCGYCQWSTLDIGIKFPKFTNLSGQLARQRNGGKQKKLLAGPQSPLSNIEKTPEKGESSPVDDSDVEPEEEVLENDELFANLVAFYRTQLVETAGSGGAGGSYGDMNFSSPASITRIMNLYSNNRRLKKMQPMRSAQTPSEGLVVFSHDTSTPSGNPELAAIQRLQEGGWHSTASSAQRRCQKEEAVRFLDELRPINTPLKTKRAKRCKTCKQILYRPDPKPTSYKSKINLVALERIPKVSLRLLSVATSSFLTHITPSTGPSDYELLKAGKTTHVLLTLTNPLFDALKVTLASPATLANGSRVTILCPQFDIGANTDVWDEALGAGPSAASRRRTLFLSGEAGTIEAGKPWEKGRNFTSIIIELIPMWPAAGNERDILEGDATLLEIPMFVRCEYESEGDERRAKEKVVEKREDAFWVVLGVGRVAK